MIDKTAHVMRSLISNRQQNNQPSYQSTMDAARTLIHVANGTTALLHPPMTNISRLSQGISSSTNCDTGRIMGTRIVGVSLEKISIETVGSVAVTNSSISEYALYTIPFEFPSFFFPLLKIRHYHTIHGAYKYWSYILGWQISFQVIYICQVYRFFFLFIFKIQRNGKKTTFP